MKSVITKPASALLAVILSLAVFASCTPAPLERSNNIEIIGAIYTRGAQTVRVISSIPNDDGALASFNADIAPTDFTLTGALEGKTVTAVTRVSEHELTLTLDGVSASADGYPYSEGFITIDSSALKHDYDSYCRVLVERPAVSITGYYYSSVDKCHVCTFALPWGSFSENVLEMISVTNAAKGTVSVEFIDDGHSIKVSVKDFKTADNIKNPVLSFSAAATPFATPFTMEMGFAGSVILE